MRHHDEFRAEPGIYFFYNKQGLVLYVGKPNNLRARLRRHEADHDVVRSWMSFFDEHFEHLNVRIRKAAESTDVNSFDRISRIIAGPLTIIDSTQAIDCCYDMVDSIKTDGCSPGELDLAEIAYIRSLKPPFNYQYNGEVSGPDRRNYFPAKYLKSKALSNLLSHYARLFAIQTLGEN